MAENMGGRRQVTDSTDSSKLREALGCVAVLVLFVICVGSPAAAYFRLDPWVGLGVAVGAWVAWLYLGPPGRLLASSGEVGDRSLSCEPADGVR